MGKAERNRARTARERIAAQQSAAVKADQRRRMLIVSGSIGLVLIVVIALLLGKSLFKTKALAAGSLSATATHQLTNVPVSTLEAVGTGSIPPVGPSLPLKAITDKPITAGGKPQMLYIGAEFCPYCAAMRWPMAIALSRFGTFGPFTGIHSAPAPEVYPDTATLTFRNQQYTSKYLTFTSVENQTVDHKPLQNPTKAEQALWVKYDSSSSGLGYPFIDFGNKVVLTGPLFVPSVLQGLTWNQIASKLHNPKDPVATSINGAANYLTASICKMTNNTPATVCTAGPIPAIEAKL